MAVVGERGERVSLQGGLQGDGNGAAGGGAVIGGRYRLGERLGRGGMGVVWRATDELLGRPVAVKALSLETGVDPEGALREARAVAKIRHPHVIVVHDVVEHEGQLVIVMELVDGGSLADRLAGPGGPMAPEEAAGVGVALIDALSAAHARRVLHRDVKPANVLLDAGTGRVVLTDFGIASLPGAPTISETGVFAGTPEYSAPERIQGGAGGPESDLWSLGALLCAAVTGESPFRRDSIGAVAHAVVYEEIRPSARLGPLLPVVSGLLERDPQRRLGAVEARRMLAACAAGGGVADQETRAAAPAPPPPGYTPTAHAAHRPTAGGGDAGDAGVVVSGGQPRPPRPRLRGARVALVVAGAVAACAGAVTAGVLLDGRSAGGQSGAVGSAPAVPGQPAPTTPTPTPTPSTPPPSTPPPSAPTSPSVPPSSPAPVQPGGVPAGFVKVDDERGFTLNVPAGSQRSTDGERVFYITPDGAVRVGIRFGTIPPGGALGSMRDSDARGPANNPGYRDNKVRATTRKGLPAAFWEFTWNGFDPAGEGPRHTYDIAWEQNGRLWDVWVSAPTGRMKEARGIHDTAVDSFFAFDH
ncbi:serine/threonine-protein kinase [Streptomyces sp. NPDC032472]|uniref:serine/threonine-protein kinase n=1 Tax=Streptomyces sp. NPDC032472 TaxID=3155018 RepID=UPI0033D26819